PVGASYAEQQYWDDTLFAVPAGAVRADVTLYHQTTSREYIEFLRDTNTTNTDGAKAYQQWVACGKSAPVALQSGPLVLASSGGPSPVVLGVSKALAAGGYPALSWSGSPTASAGNFAIVMTHGKPNVLGVLYASANTATVPYAGALRYLKAPLTRAPTVPLDRTGGVTVPIPVTGAMIGTAKNYQVVFRDAQAYLSLGISNGVHAEFCP